MADRCDWCGGTRTSPLVKVHDLRGEAATVHDGVCKTSWRAWIIKLTRNQRRQA